MKQVNNNWADFHESECAEFTDICWLSVLVKIKEWSEIFFEWKFLEKNETYFISNTLFT